MLKTLKLDLDCKIDKHDYLTIMQGFTYNYEFYVFDDGEAVDLTGVTVNIDFMKPDKKFIIKTSGISKDGNKLMFGSDLDYTNISGKAKMQVVLKKNYMVYGSWVIDVVIKPSAINDNDGQSENKLTITQELKDVIAKAEADIVSIPIEAEKKITELTNQANTSIDTLKTNTQKTLTDLTNQANTSINNVSTNADTKINALITKSNQTIANLEQAIANGDIESIKNEVFEKEYGTFTTNKSMASVGETTVTAYGITTLEEPMLEEDVTTTLEESTEEENGIMTMEEPMLLADTVVEPIKTGIPKSATLKGNTLVNLSKVKSCATYNKNPESNIEVKANQTYIAFHTLTSQNNSTEATMFCVSSVKLSGTLETGDEVYIQTIQNGKGTEHKVKIGDTFTKFTTKSNETYLHIRTGGSANQLSYDNLVILEYQDGMENWDIPYFTGIASVVNPNVTSVGKNLFDGIMNQGSVNATNGVEVDDANSNRTDYILLPKGTYVISNDGVKRVRNVITYNESKVYTGTFGAVDVFTLTEKCYVRLSGSTGNTDKLQLESGSTPTTYEPYKSNTVTTTEEVVLRSLPNGVCDTLNLITGEYVQRIGEIVLNGSENWKLNNTSNSELITFEIPLFPSDILVHDFNDKTITITSTLLRQVDYLNNECYLTHNLMGNRWTVITVKRSKLATEDLTGFKDWLSKNQVIMQYQLATPVIKTVDLTGLPFAYENGHILLSADSILPTYEYEVATTLKSQGENTAEELLDVKLNKLGKTEKASDSVLLNGAAEDVNVSNNTIVKRGNAGQIYGKAFYLENNNSLASKNTSGSYVALAYMNNANSTVYGAITNPMLLRSQKQPKLNINGTEKEILSQHNLPIESGTFTPNIKTITSGVSFTLNEDTFGRYQRIGNKVFVNMRIAWTTKNNAPTGEGVVIGGLPYAPRYSYETLTIGLYHGLGLPSSALELVTHISSGNGGIVLYYTQSATNWLIYTPQHINNEGSIAISGFYTI